ncbi:magnesium transporter [Luteimonas lutimaris]|uniref:Magnesium transporter MgtE n=1 Tax=Luteimonas lutimaris TaxID=698645 RepID=A0ABP7M696_9GAMM|nr:magnesium transporter [Luteimonas sp.]
MNTTPRNTPAAADAARLAAPFADLNIADGIERLNALDPAQAAATVQALPWPRVVDMFDRSELQHASAIAALLPGDVAGRLLDDMADDRAADVFLELDEDTRANLVGHLGAGTLASIRTLMRYPAGTAGSLMTTEFVSVPAHWTVAQTLAHIRQVERSRETVYAIYVLDARTRALLRMVSLRRLISGDPDASILDVAQETPPVTVAPLLDQEDIARLIRRHDLLAIPVVDDAGHVLGIVTVDDIIDTMIDETTEDVQKFGGMAALEKPYMQIGFGRMIHKRAGWLCVLFLGEMLTASAMQHYEVELAQAVVLTLFIPLIMSSGGNSGSQATSLLIRGLALHEVRLRDWWRVALRELPTGLLLGAMLGTIAIARISLWQLAGFYDYGPHWMLLAATVAAALVGIVTFGSLSGSMLPFLMQRLGFDPASASAPFVATLVDVTGLVIYFSIASMILGGTLL